MANIPQTIKFIKVYNEAGEFSHLRLVQGERYITITFGSTGLDHDPFKHNYKWELLKELVDKFAAEVHGNG